MRPPPGHKACAPLSLAALVAALTAAAGACGGGSGSAADGGPGLADSHIAVVRVASWPAGGRELTLRIDPGAGGSPDPVDVAGAIRVTAHDSALAPRWSAHPVALSPGYTAVLVAPARDAGGRAAQRAALRALLEGRPAGEQIAILVWRDAVDQALGFTTDRALLGRAIDAALPDPGPAAPAPVMTDAAITDAAHLVAEVGGLGPRGMRALVVMPGPLAPLDVDRARTAAGGVAVVPLAPATDAADPADDAGAASDEIDRLAAHTHYTLALCGGPDQATVNLSVEGLTGHVSAALPPAWPDDAPGPCDPDAIATGPQPLPDTIAFELTPAQRSVYDQRVARRDKTDFDLSVRLAPDRAAVPATAHLHGRGTLSCQRKSYTVDLSGPPRYLWPDGYDHQMFLLSMCQDENYIQLYTAGQLMADLDLYPLGARYVDLTIDGQQQGIYLLIDKADDTLERDHSRVASVLRRRFDSGTESVEVEKSRAGDPAAAAADWNDVVASLDGLSGAELESAAVARLDLDRFFTWLALMTALQNSDYVDEVWLTATDALDSGGALIERYTPMGWDNDDLFVGCHYGGQYAFDDPNQLVYCAEGRLEQILLDDPVTYDRYVNALAAVLDWLTPRRMQAALDRTRTDLAPLLARADVCGAMIELLATDPEATDPAEAQRAIDAGMTQLGDQVAARRTLLQQRISTYRAALRRQTVFPP